MRATIKNYMDAVKQRREEESEEGGFSLIELIIVVVIIGILAAIAIPVFAGIQRNANDAAAQSAAANGATAAAILASESGAVAADVTGNTYADLVEAPVTGVAATITGVDISTICVTASYTGGNFSAWRVGPGCGATAGGVAIPAGG